MVVLLTELLEVVVVVCDLDKTKVELEEVFERLRHIEEPEDLEYPKKELPSFIVPRRRRHYDIVANVGVAVIPKDYVFPAEMPSKCLHPRVYKDFKDGLAEGKCSACRALCYMPMRLTNA